MTKDHLYEDVYIAICDAFAAVRQQLEDKGGKLEGFVKLHIS